MLEEVLSKENMTSAYNRVVSNKGAAGVDGLSVDELRHLLSSQWSFIRAKILEGKYKPACVKQVIIPKANGGERKLGIPTVLDRLIQQAISQRLVELYDATFSENSYGFRPNRNAHRAVHKAQELLNEERTYVIELDLEQFFDRVNHDKLMHLLSRKVKDKMLLKLIRSYLVSGILIGDEVMSRTEGTPQGSPLSPVLSNILLDELDKELESRGHRFVRYADDCSIYVKSRKAAERVKSSITRFIEDELLLKVNQEKTQISRPSKSTLLGFSFYKDKAGYQIRIAPKSLERIKGKVRQLTSRRKPYSLETRLKTLKPVITGWVNYFKIAKARMRMVQLDEWLRIRLRICVWKLWKKAGTKIRELVKLGITQYRAIQWGQTRLMYCRIAHSPILTRSLTIDYFAKQGYVSFESVYVKS
jgi:RNA-directed DNA polymerase